MAGATSTAECVELDARSISDFVVDIEQRFPVDRLVIDGIAIWPLLRIQLYFKLFSLGLLSGTGQKQSRMRRLAVKIKQHADNQWRGLMAERVDAERTLRPPERADVVLVSDGVSQVRGPYGWYDRFCDPIATLVQRQEYSAATFTLGTAFNVPRMSRGLFLQPKMDRLRLAARLRTVLPSRGLISVIGHLEGINAALRRESAELGFEPRLLSAQVAALQLIAAKVRHRLVRCGAKAVFIVDYYNLERMAVCHAAHTIGIPTVELQHGVAGTYHVAYGRWTRPPLKGYTILPDRFWTWSEEDAASINSWASSTSGAHSAQRVGNVFAIGWHAGLVPRRADFESRVRMLINRQSGRHRYLVALQLGLMREEVLRPLLIAVASTCDRANWWFRLHPTQSGEERESLRRLLWESGICNAEIDEPSDLPLFYILSEADVMLTHSSSVVLEAESLGVPSILLSRYGADLFTQSVAKGTALTAFDAASIVNVLDKLSRAEKQARTVSAEQLVNVEQALAAVLAKRREEL